MTSQLAIKQDNAYMNIVITTGCPHSGWETSLSTLQQLGLKEIGNTFTEWCNDLFQEADITNPLQLNQPLQPNNAQANKATNLLSDKAAGPLLWADSRNLWLLDFWAATFPQASFLLFYTHPESALACALQQKADPEEFIEAWQATSLQLLRFQRRNRHRSLLLDAEMAVQHPEALVNACQRIGLTLQLTDTPSSPTTTTSTLERLLADQLLRDQPAIQNLQMELEASTLPLGETTTHEPPQPIEAYHHYQQWQAQLKQLTHARDEQTKLAADHQVQLTKAKQTQVKLETANKEAEQENELLLLQLHQIQEELETSFQQKQQLQTQIEQLSKEKQKTANKEVEQENELLLLQLHQVQEELEHYFLKYQELEQKSENKPATGESSSTKPQKANTSTSIFSKLFRPTSKAKKRLQKQTHLLKESRLFDKAWYLAEYPDVAQAGIDPIKHYLLYGTSEGRNPSREFNTAYYLATNPDVATTEINPLIHYIQYGQEEGRSPSNR